MTETEKEIRLEQGWLANPDIQTFNSNILTNPALRSSTLFSHKGFQVQNYRACVGSLKQVRKFHLT